MKNFDLKEIVRLVYQALEDKKAEDISIIDISEISVISDYFIVASGNNQNQLLAMQDEVDRVLHEHGISVKQVEGNRTSTWILMDYEDLIIHLFSKEDRLFYNLERIWQDGIVIDPAEL